MATPNSPSATPNPMRIVAMQSAMPAALTESGTSCSITVPAPLTREALQSRLRIVLYYNRNGRSGGDYDDNDDSALSVAAWIKESLSVALAEHPVLAGRLRKDREGDGYWDVKCNDAGIRLVQAAVDASMDEFFNAEDGREEKLAYWVDIDRDDPDVSALFYVQVTEFKGNGYSIGISCSLFLADPLFLAQFLKKLAQAHIQIVAQSLNYKPMFHLSYFRNARGRPTHLKSVELDSVGAATDSTNETTFFKFPWNPNREAQVNYTALALRCMKEAAKRIEGPIPVSEFLLFVNEPCKIEICQNESTHADIDFDRAMDVASWDELGLDELAFNEENKPVRLSCRTVSSYQGGLVVVMTPSDEIYSLSSELTICVTVPKKVA